MSKLVFIIDDDQVYLRFMQTHFNQMEDYKVEIYNSGDTALQQLESKTPFLIILDHNLNDPSGNGIHYLKLIKNCYR